MNKEKEIHLLELARADIWWLLNYSIVTHDMIWRCGATAEAISKYLDDKADFEPTLQRWLSSDASLNREEIISFLNANRAGPSAK